ncbi:MAG: ATP-dependent DNA helicase RecG [Neisseriaceae bacterium]
MLEFLEPIAADAKVKAKLQELNLNTYWDLLLHIPIRYEDLTKKYRIIDVAIGAHVLIEGEVLTTEIIGKRTKQLQVRLSDGTQIISLIFFHFYPNYDSQYRVGKRIRAFGEIKLDYHRQKCIIHPKIQSINDETSQQLSNTFTPVYSTVKGLSQQQIIKLVEIALSKLSASEALLGDFLDKYKYMSINQALFTLHKLTPKQYSEKVHIKALERLKFDEILAQQLVMHNAYMYKHKAQASPLIIDYQSIQRFIIELPFELTNAQKKVLNEIYIDLAKPVQMNRLLQGDVGSGKTIVATLAILAAVHNKYQACMIAPTEILAEQHYNKIRTFLDKFGVDVIWLSGSLSPKEKKDAYNKIIDGESQVIIGTHAVFQKNVVFKNLAFVIVDEQHRFGVKQRLMLQDKGLNPHQLMMSATPIPRSLAMSYYADLDVSTIDELPLNRTPIKTILINNNRRSEVIQYIDNETRKSRQVYWVCPLIEESEKLGLENTVNVYNELQERLPHLKIGLIHGKLKSQEKADIMQKFLSNNLQVLVATTVIEVGVDVPNASIIVIEHSERMGLSQLHQLRGRVGRGSIESNCILLYQNALSDIAKKRLKVIYENTDGFKIAHEDLLIRGPGELLGSRQSGLPLFRFANLEFDLELIPLAKEAAKDILLNNRELFSIYTKLWLYDHTYFKT